MSSRSLRRTRQKPNSGAREPAKRVRIEEREESESQARIELDSIAAEGESLADRIASIGASNSTTVAAHASAPSQVGEEETQQSQRREEDGSQHIVTLANTGNTTARATRRSTVTNAMLQQRVNDLEQIVETLTARVTSIQSPPPAPIPPVLAYLAEVLHIEERGLDVLLQRPDVELVTEDRISFAPTRSEVQEIIKLRSALGEVRGVVQELRAQLERAAVPDQASPAKEDAVGGRITALEQVMQQVMSQALLDPAASTGTRAARPMTAPQAQAPSSSPERRGGGGEKAHNTLHCAFTMWTCSAMGIGTTDPLPNYVDPPPTTAEGQTLLRVNWTDRSTLGGDSPIVRRYLASAELREDLPTKLYVDSLDGKMASQDHQDLCNKYGDHGFLPLEAMSEDETAGEEEVLTIWEESAVVRWSRNVSIAIRVPWLLQESDNIITEMDKRIEQQDSHNARHVRTILCPPRANIPNDPALVELIPSTVHRFMVAERFKNLYPAAVENVQDNVPPTKANQRVNVVCALVQWGRDPSFEFVESSAGSGEVAIQSEPGPSRRPDSYNNALDPALASSQHQRA
ncbi:uncharacterized protein UTRI_01291 [Ustilago trichophora]|uniref:Uncharacterized protein n=1 Tax=Ustilago trichophora TaxID=86804 RepID=A0A5C3DVZ6_9BASI|nr:uncharacterized protein UTRI_01291 [Ustilago trichophora]